MKVKIKDLRPNPFRNIKSYPINEAKVKNLISSIEQTGFWDNILTRQKNGKIEIAYGHHRLMALQRKFKSDHIIDIPIKDLDDPAMIKIMANENDEDWATSAAIIDETIRATKRFLLSPPGQTHIKIKNPKRKINYQYSKEAFWIAKFLGGTWGEKKVYSSLQRIKAVENGEVDKKAIENLPTAKAAERFTRHVKKIKNVSPEEQRVVVKKLVKDQDYSESAIQYNLLGEKYKQDDEKWKKKREEERRQFEFFLRETSKIARKLRNKLSTLYDYRDILFSEPYANNYEAQMFIYDITQILKWFEILVAGGDEKKKRNKEENIEKTLRMFLEGKKIANIDIKPEPKKADIIDDTMLLKKGGQ